MVKPKKTGVVPNLRFPEFRGAADWSLERLDRLYSFMRNNTLSRDKLNYENGAAKNIHYGDIHTKFSSHFDIAKEHVPFVNPSEDIPVVGSDDYCVEGDIVLADASEDTNDVGKSIEIIRLDGQSLLAGQHTILARRKDGRLVQGFGGFLFRSVRIRSQIQKEAQGTKVFQISPTRLGGIEIAYPVDEKEQRKIADCLKSLDELIAAQRRKVEALKTYKRGLMQQLFPREGETVPRLRFPEFKNTPGWKKMPFGKAATFFNGRAYSKDELLSVGKYKVLRVGNFFTSDRWHFSDLELDETKYCDQGDLLYAWSASFGPRIWRGSKAIYHYHIWKVIENHGIDRIFLFLSLENETNKMKSRSANGIGMFHITKGTIEGWPALFPEPDEQRKISEFISSIDANILSEQQKCDGFMVIKTSLMQQLFPAAEASEA